MKCLLTAFCLVLFISGVFGEKAAARKSPGSGRIVDSDWSPLFPDISGCERIIKPVEPNGNALERTAMYVQSGFMGRVDRYFQAAARLFYVKNQRSAVWPRNRLKICCHRLHKGTLFRYTQLIG